MFGKRFLALGAAVTIAGGCVAATSAPEALRPDHRATVLVQNRNWQDVRVYVERVPGTQPFAIGTVPKYATRSLAIEQSALMAPVRFLIRPVGNTSDSLWTERTQMAPGHSVAITVANGLWLSSRAMLVIPTPLP